MCKEAGLTVPTKTWFDEGPTKFYFAFLWLFVTTVRSAGESGFQHEMDNIYEEITSSINYFSLPWPNHTFTAPEWPIWYPNLLIMLRSFYTCINVPNGDSKMNINVCNKWIHEFNPLSLDNKNDPHNILYRI